jgi:Zn finger protein HypA/HybF involved in hydrogenase expression
LHELSVALEIRRIAEERLALEELPHLVSVGVELGDTSGLEPDNLRFCLEAVFAEPPFTGARPVFERLPGDVLRVSYLEVDDGRPDD